MKIKNDLITIKVGKKQYDFKNLILDEYLKVFAQAQLNEEDIKVIKNNKYLRYVLIKFDTPLNNITEKSILKNEDFDIAIVSGETSSQEINDCNISIKYTYKTTENFAIRDYSTKETIYNDISKFYGKKITALGFNRDFSTLPNVNANVCAVLDTSNYNIYLQENQDFTVTRKDIITTDALFYSNDKAKVSGPIHLAPYPNKAVIKPNEIYNTDKTAWTTGADESYGIIYSIGLSSYIDRIDKEFIIGQDVQIVQNETSLKISNIENLLAKYSTYVNSNLYLNSNLYPSKADYKYLIVKYKVWQEILSGTYENPVKTITDTGYYYHQAIEIAKLKGNLNLEIAYERG